VVGVAAKASTGSPNLLLMLLGALLVALGVFILAGLYTIQPNQAAVLSLFGKYVGTVKDNGLRWNNPFLPSAGSASACATSRAAS
jgi:regulator of protease activity HflC (stomatin/prohibitin superfamily)